MRNQPTTSRLMAWMFAPLLVVACGQEGAGGTPEFVTIPLCSGPDQVLSTNSVGQLICKPLPPGAAALPDCKKYSQSLTSDGSKVFCTNRNNEAQGTRDALDKLEQSEILIKEYTTKLNSLGGPSGPAPRATYCGQYAPGGVNNPNGAITDSATGVTGVLAAATLCRKVTGCNAQSAKMCTVYDMYHSVATGVVTSAMNIGQAWVFMASWGFNGGNSGNTGLNDNCGGYTYPTGDRSWYGTTVEWKAAITGPKALHFAGASSSAGVSCAARFPIACCN